MFNIEDNIVHLDGDITIDTNTMNGILAVKLMKAQIMGEDISDILDDVDGVLNAYEKPEQDRSLYRYSTDLWPNGEVSYVWGSISANAKEAVKQAMNDWSQKTSKIQFIDRTNDKFYQFMAAIWLVPCVKITEDNNMTPYGSTTVGRVCGYSTCKINYGHTIPDIFKFRTPRHELGHVLGLNHEHQRYDRDLYLSTTQNISGDTAYSVIPLTTWGVAYDVYYTYESVILVPGYTQTTSYQIYTYPQGYQTIYQTYYIPPVMGVAPVPHYRPSYKEYPISNAYSPFDYESIMLYSYGQSGFRAKFAMQGLKVGDPIPINSNISNGDIEAVKKMYR